MLPLKLIPALIVPPEDAQVRTAPQFTQGCRSLCMLQSRVLGE